MPVLIILWPSNKHVSLVSCVFSLSGKVLKENTLLASQTNKLINLSEMTVVRGYVRLTL